MRPYDSDGLELRSDEVTCTPGKQVRIDLKFLDPALQQMQFPEITRLDFDFENCAIDGGTDVVGEDLWRLLADVTLQDGSAQRIKGSGANLLRQMSSLVYRGTHLDPASVTTDNDTNVDRTFSVPLELPNVLENPADTRIGVAELRTGTAALLVTFGNATLNGAAADSWTTGTFRVVAHVVERRKGVAPVRMCWREFAAITNQRDRYTIDGDVFALWGVGAEAAAAAYNAWTTIDAVDIPELGISNMRRHLQVRKYALDGIPTWSGDEFVAGNAYPFFMPRQGQQLTKLREITSARIELDAAAPGDSVLCGGIIIPRDPAVTAVHMRYPSAAAWQSALLERGEVKTSGHGEKRVKMWPSHLVRRLPVTVPGRVS